MDKENLNNKTTNNELRLKRLKEINEANQKYNIENKTKREMLVKETERLISRIEYELSNFDGELPNNFIPIKDLINLQKLSKELDPNYTRECYENVVRQYNIIDSEFNQLCSKCERELEVR